MNRFLKSTFLWGLILSSLLLWPYLQGGFFPHHDDLQVIRLFEMHQCIKDLQIPCRWVPNIGGEYGYPLFNYYAPLPYYFGEIIYLISGNLIFSVKVMFVTAFLGSYIFMYLLGRKLWGDWGGFFAGIFFSFAPYHASLLYVRGAMGELWGVMLFPAIFWALLRLQEKITASRILTMILFFTLILLSHNLSALIFIPLSLGFALALTLLLKNKRKAYLFLTTVAFSLTASLALSAFYILPMVMERDLVHLETTTMGYFYYTEHFKGIKKLLLDTSWGFGVSVREIPGGERDGMSFQIGLIHVLFLLVTLGLFKFIKEQYKRWVLTFFILMTALAVFMVHPRSVEIWNLIPPLKYLQFPWRFLGVIIFSLSAAIGSLAIFREKKWFKWSVVLIIILLLGYNFRFFQPKEFLNLSDQDFLTGSLWEKQIMRSAFDYLPKSADFPPAQPAKVRFEVLTGDATVTDFKSGSNWFEFTASASRHSIIRLSQYDFPLWKITSNDRDLRIDSSNNRGLMTIFLGEGKHQVKGVLENTIIRSLGNLISLMALSVFIVFSLLQFQIIKRRIAYYLRAFNS